MSRNAPFFMSAVKITFTHSNIVYIYNCFDYASLLYPIVIPLRIKTEFS